MDRELISGRSTWAMFCNNVIAANAAAIINDITSQC